MMTMLVTTLEMLPAALSRAIGSDSQLLFAIVIISYCQPLCLVGTAYRSAAAFAVAAAGAAFGLASDPGAPLSDEALVATGRADEFMI